MDDEQQLTPEESLRLIERQRAEALRQLDPSPLLFFLPWGMAWLFGYGTYFLWHGFDGAGVIAMSGWVPGLVMGVLLAAAFLITAFASIRSGQRVAGNSTHRGVLYGVAWMVAFATFTTLGGQLSPHLPDSLVGLYWAAMPAGLVAVLYLAGAALWLDRSMLVLGVWIGAVNLLGIMLGLAWHSLTISVAGGGGMVVTGIVLHLRHRRLTRRQETRGRTTRGRATRGRTTRGRTTRGRTTRGRGTA